MCNSGRPFECWDWGPGCNHYLKSAGLCKPDSVHPSVFADYEYAAGHMTAADPKAQPLVASEIHKFLTASP